MASNKQARTFTTLLIAGVMVLGVDQISAQNVGIGTNVPISKLSVNGGLSVGSTFANGNTAAPTNGAAIQGNVGIGTTSPDASTMLDITSSSKGLSLPNVALTSATDNTTVVSPKKGLLVFNPGTGGLAPAGIYYNIGTSASPNWVKVVDGSSGVTSISSVSPLTANTSATGAVTVNLTGIVPVGNGGTGANTLTTNGLLVGNGTSTVQTTPAPTTSQFYLKWNGSSFEWGNPAGTNGQFVGVTPIAMWGPEMLVTSNSWQNVSRTNYSTIQGMFPQAVPAGYTRTYYLVIRRADNQNASSIADAVQFRLALDPTFCSGTDKPGQYMPLTNNWGSTDYGTIDWVAIPATPWTQGSCTAPYWKVDCQMKNPGFQVRIMGMWVAAMDVAGTVTAPTVVTATTGNATKATASSFYDLVNSDGTTVSMASVMDMTSHKITSVTDPTAAQDAATKNYVDSRTTSSVTGAISGTAGYHAKFTGTNTLGNGLIYDDGTNVSIGLAGAGALKLDVVGSIGIRNAAVWDHLYMTHDGATAHIRAGGAESGLAFEVSGTGTGAYGAQTYATGMTLLPVVVSGVTTSVRVGVGTLNPGDAFQVSAGEGPSIPGLGVFLSGGFTGNAKMELRGGTPYIDFANNGASTDYDMRLLMNTPGNLQLNGGTLDMTGHKIVSVTDPTNAQDAATKNYVDNRVTGTVSGTSGYHAKFTGTNTIGNSVVYENGTNVGIGTTAASQMLQLQKSGTDNYIKVDAGGTGGNYSGIMLTEYNINYGFSMRMNAANDNLYISHQDNTPTFSDLVAITPGGNMAVGPSSLTHQFSVGSAATADGQAVTIRGYSNTPGSWKGGGAFGYTSATVIMGELNGVAQIGGHNSTLSAWANLALNSGGGNVGIGTNNPQNKLQVEGNLHMDGNPIYFRAGPTDAYDLIKWNSSTDRVDVGGYNGVSLGYTSAAAGSITPILNVIGGAVGINNTSPYSTLDVSGNIYASVHGSTNEHDASNRGTTRLGMKVGNDGSDGFAGMEVTTEASPGGCGNGGMIKFNTWGCNISGSREVMRIDEFGNIFWNYNSGNVEIALLPPSFCVIVPQGYGCPSGWTQKDVGWDTADAGNADYNKDGTVASDYGHSSSLQMRFCCRGTGWGSAN